jgi:hypothetical protein
MLLRRSLAAAAVASALAWLAPSRADAYEHQWHAGLSLGYSMLADPQALHGFGGGLHLTYGLTDAFNLMLIADVTGHPGKAGVVGSKDDPPRPDIVVLGGSAGVGYVIDILQWVPYVGVMAGGYDVWALDLCGAPDTRACHSGRLGLSAVGGLDYQINPSFAVGGAVRGTLLIGAVPVGGAVTAFARAEYIWGY